MRNNLGFSAIADVASFSVDAAYGAIMSVDADGTLTALDTHWAQAPVAVTNACDGGEVDEVSLYVNPTASPGQLDLGEASQAPLQPGSGSLEVKLWWDLSETYSGACGEKPIETIAAFFLYQSRFRDFTTPQKFQLFMKSVFQFAWSCFHEAKLPNLGDAFCQKKKPKTKLSQPRIVETRTKEFRDFTKLNRFAPVAHCNAIILRLQSVIFFMKI